MLRYLNKGSRHYGFKDIHPPDHCRSAWEIMVLERGSLRPRPYQETPLAMVKGPAMWIMPADSRHCWESPRTEPCEVMVFNFACMHPLMENWMYGQRLACIKLSAPDLEEIIALYDRVSKHFLNPKPISALAYNIAMLQLAEVALRSNLKCEGITDYDVDSERVLHALAWHREHMASGIKVADVAKALHLSRGHLRRIFMRVRKMSPKEAFAHEKFDEASRLLSLGNLTLKEVAVRCGFQGFSEFYRFFKRCSGQSPSTWKSGQFYGDLIKNQRAASSTQAEQEA